MAIIDLLRRFLRRWASSEKQLRVIVRVNGKPVFNADENNMRDLAEFDGGTSRFSLHMLKPGDVVTMEWGAVEWGKPR